MLGAKDPRHSAGVGGRRERPVAEGSATRKSESISYRLPSSARARNGRYRSRLPRARSRRRVPHRRARPEDRLRWAGESRCLARESSCRPRLAATPQPPWPEGGGRGESLRQGAERISARELQRIPHPTHSHRSLRRNRGAGILPPTPGTTAERWGRADTVNSRDSRRPSMPDDPRFRQPKGQGLGPIPAGRQDDAESRLAAHHAVVGLACLREWHHFVHRTHSRARAEGERVLGVDRHPRSTILRRCDGRDQREQRRPTAASSGAPRTSSDPSMPRPPIMALIASRVGHRGEHDAGTAHAPRAPGQGPPPCCRCSDRRRADSASAALSAPRATATV